MKLTYYIFNIVFYSIIGFIFEKSLGIIFNYNVQSGFAYGPYSIIYGISLSLIFFLFSEIEKHYTFNKSKKLILFFLIPFILLTLFEYISGTLIEKVYGITFWNYENLLFNIGKYISLETSLIWGVFPIITYYYIKPKTDKLYSYINNIIIYLSFIIIILDYLISIILAF